MARRRKATKKVSYKRRRSVGGMSANVLTDIAGVVAGSRIADSGT